MVCSVQYHSVNILQSTQAINNCMVLIFSGVWLPCTVYKNRIVYMFAYEDIDSSRQTVQLLQKISFIKLLKYSIKSLTSKFLSTLSVFCLWCVFEPFCYSDPSVICNEIFTSKRCPKERVVFVLSCVYCS